MLTLSSKKNFKFQGFIPDDILKQKSLNFYNMIEKRSPSDATKQAILTKKGTAYEARLKITSAGSCSFEIFSQEKSVSDSIDSLQKQFYDKILEWNQSKNP